MQDLADLAVSSDPSASNRWVMVGTSLLQDDGDAVAEALAPIQAKDNTKLAIIYCSPAHDLTRISRLVKDALGDTEIIGCSTAGELVRHRSINGGLLIWALGGDGFSVTTGVGQGDANSGLRDAAFGAAQCLNDLQRREHTILFLLADGLCGDQMEVVRGAYDVSGASVPLVGGCAGDDMALQTTQQIHSGEILSKSVVAAAITSDAPMAIGIAHGWQPFSEPMLVTESLGTTLVSLDDQPALDVYLDRYDAPEAARHDQQAFFDFAHTRPIGVARRNRTEIRYVYGADFDKRTITVFAEVPQGAMAQLMHGSPSSVLQATAEVCAQAEESLGGLPAAGFMLLECVARKSLLTGAGMLEESLSLPTLRSDVPVGGFYTYGEIARTEGPGGLHNQTVVALALA